MLIKASREARVGVCLVGCAAFCLGEALCGLGPTGVKSQPASLLLPYLGVPLMGVPRLSRLWYTQFNLIPPLCGEVMVLFYLAKGLRMQTDHVMTTRKWG